MLLLLEMFWLVMLWKKKKKKKRMRMEKEEGRELVIQKILGIDLSCTLGQREKYQLRK